MKYREFGKTGFKVSVVGMGTFYDAMWIAMAMLLRIRRGSKRKLEALRLGLDAGINFIDTAEIYQSEPIVAEAIEGRKRDELFIASKAWSNHLKAQDLERACRKSLKRLKTQYLDLYQLHFPNSRVPITETMGAMEKLVDEGLIRAIGLSNFSYEQMIAAEQALKKHAVSSTQMHYNLTKRDVERDVLPHCEKEKIALIAYYPLAHGKLAKSGADVIGEIAANRSKKPAEIALSWLVKRSDMIFPIPRASNPEHVKDDADASDVELSESEFQRISEAFPFH